MAEVTKEAKAFFSDLRQYIEWWSKHHSQIPFSGELNESNVMHANMIEALRIGRPQRHAGHLAASHERERQRLNGIPPRK